MDRAEAAGKGDDVHGSIAEEPESALESREEAAVAASEVRDLYSSP